MLFRLLDRQQQKAKEQEQLQKEMAGEDEAEGLEQTVSSHKRTQDSEHQEWMRAAKAAKDGS